MLFSILSVGKRWSLSANEFERLDSFAFEVNLLIFDNFLLKIYCSVPDFLKISRMIEEKATVTQLLLIQAIRGFFGDFVNYLGFDLMFQNMFVIIIFLWFLFHFEEVLLLTHKWVNLLVFELKNSLIHSEIFVFKSVSFDVDKFFISSSEFGLTHVI